MGASGQSGFECEVLAGCDPGFQLTQEDATCGHHAALGSERRDSGRNQVGVDEVRAARDPGQVFQREGRLFPRRWGQQ
jgi:hypothetical protein